MAGLSMLKISGAMLLPRTVRMMLAESVATSAGLPLPSSVTRNVTGWLPTSAVVGVQLSTAVP